jgi:hypothetical protein
MRMVPVSIAWVGTVPLRCAAFVAGLRAAMAAAAAAFLTGAPLTACTVGRTDRRGEEE